MGKTNDADHFARDALALHARLFRVWHRYRGGTIDSERTIRTAVQWRKICFGNRSEEGEVAPARLLTAAETCSIQKRNLLHYLTEAVRCHRKGLPAPSLVPTAA